MKTLLMILALMFSTLSFAHDIPTNIIDAGVANIYKIKTEQQTSGSAFYIGDNQLITACHVVINSTNVVLVSAYGKYVLTASVESCNDVNDIAILELDDDPVDGEAFSGPPLIISMDEPRHGQTVYGAGYPIIFSLTFVDGHWQDMHTLITDDEKIAMVTVPAIFGDSGSPLLAIIDGEVVVIGIRLGIFSWPVSGEPNKFGPTDMGFVSGLSYIGTSESVQIELDKLDEAS